MPGNIIIDLTKPHYSDATAYSEDHLIHQEQMKQMMLIWEKLYREASTTKEEMQHRYHNAISIFASRGAGKTSFLLSFLDKIKNSDKYSIVCLKSIDPSLIESKQHPFVCIIASIHETVEHYKDIRYYDARDSRFDETVTYRKHYQKLLKALPFVDGIGKASAYDNWDDDDFVAAQGMEKATASNNLVDYFHEYIRCVLKLLGKTCMVIPFDDIDTDFKKGYEMLEVIRKYLTSAQIIPIITGDLELYGKLVRKASWGCFDPDFLSKETEYAQRDGIEFSDMIDQLENQYLIKVLKPENRIRLKTIQEYQEEGENLQYAVKVKLNQEKQERNLEWCYRKLIQYLGFGARNLGVSNEIIRFLSGLSMRVQVRLLTLFDTIQNQFPTAISTRADEEVLRILETNLFDIFWNDINQKTSNGKALMKMNDLYGIEMLRFLVETRSLHVGASFQPITNDSVLNKALFTIGARFNMLAYKHNFMVFDYWSRVAYTRILTEQLDGNSDISVIHSFLRYSHLDTESGLTKSIGLGQAFCNHALNRDMHEQLKTMPGTICIHSASISTSMNFQHICAMIPFLGTIDNAQNEYTFASIYKLLAAVCELSHQDYNYARENAAISYFRQSVEKWAQYRYYLEPSAIRSKNDVEDRDSVPNLPIIEPIEINKQWSDLFKDFTKWREHSTLVTAQLLDRIFTRFYYTLTQIDRRKQYNSVGDKLNDYIISLLNSALVESVLERATIEVNLNYIDDIEQIYIENIQRIKKARNPSKVYAFYFWLSQCPLLTMFLNPIIYELSKEEPKSNEEQSLIFDEIKYNQLQGESYYYERKLKELKKKLEEYENAAKWIRQYQQWLGILDDLESYKRMLNNTEDAQFMNSLQEKIEGLRKSKKKLEKQLAPLCNIDGILLSFHLDKKEVEQKADKILIKLKRINDETQGIMIQISDSKKLCETIAPAAVQDYEERKKRLGDSSIYHILSQISIL